MCMYLIACTCVCVKTFTKTGYRPAYLTCVDVLPVQLYLTSLISSYDQEPDLKPFLYSMYCTDARHVQSYIFSCTAFISLGRSIGLLVL